MSLLLALLLASPEAPPLILRAPVDRAHLPGVATPVAPPMIRTPPMTAPLGVGGPTRAVPRIPLHRLISIEDYPAAARAAGQQGMVHVALDIAPEGRVTGCTIVGSSRSAILDSSTCRILRSRARFTPARDSAGKAVTDRHHQRIDWRLPAAPQMPPAVQAAVEAWARCIAPHLEAGARTPTRTSHELADLAMLPCRAQEDQMLTTMAAAKNAPAPGEKERAGLREQVVSRIEAARKAK